VLLYFIYASRSCSNLKFEFFSNEFAFYKRFEIENYFLYSNLALAHFLSFLKPGPAGPAFLFFSILPHAAHSSPVSPLRLFHFLFFPFFPLGPAQVWSFSLHALPDKPMPPPQHDGLTRLINPARQGSQPGRAAARHLPFIIVPSLRPHRIAGATPEPSACARAMTLPDSSRIDIRIVIEPRFSPF
jgi:hypothetical protein